MCFIKLKEKKKMICVIGFCCRFRSEIYIYVMITFFLSFLQESVCVCVCRLCVDPFHIRHRMFVNTNVKNCEKFITDIKSSGGQQQQDDVVC